MISEQVPEWMLSIKKLQSRDRRRMEMSAPRRHRISTVSGYDLKKRKFKKDMVQKRKSGGQAARQEEEDSDEN